MKRFVYAIKWTLLVIVKPCIMLWIIVNGIPPCIRAIGSVVSRFMK